MKTINFKSQSAEAVNSAVAKIFANVSVKETADKFIKVLKKNNIKSGKGEYRVSDDFRVKIDGCINDNCEYIINVTIEEKNGHRFANFGKMQFRGVAERKIFGIALSEVYYGIQDTIYEIVDNVLYDNEKWAVEDYELGLQHNYFINTWEELTGLDFSEVVMGLDPMPESAEVTEEDVINEVVGIINANLIENYTEGQKLDWSLFNDSTMEYLFANGGPELYNKIIVRVAQISDCLAYDDCFYVWYMDVPVKNDAPCLETEDPLTYENVKLFAEQYDIHMGCDGKYVLPRGIAQDNWDEYLTLVENIDLEYPKEYWDKFWKIYCNVMCDLWKEEYEVVVDNCHDRLIFTPMIDENDAPTSEEIEEIVENAPCLDDAENVRDYLNNDERAFFVLPDYDYVCGLFVEYNEDDDVYVAMGNESWNVTEYDGDTDMSVVIADFSNAWAKEIDEYCDFYKGLDYDRRIYRNDDYDAYMILLNSGVSHGLNVEEGYDPYKGDYVEVIA